MRNPVSLRRGFLERGRRVGDSDKTARIRCVDAICKSYPQGGGSLHCDHRFT